MPLQRWPPLLQDLAAHSESAQSVLPSQSLSLASPQVASALREIGERTLFLKVLGSYPAG